jgi:flagellar protein FlaI
MDALERLKKALSRLAPLRLPPTGRVVPEPTIETLSAKIYGRLLAHYEVAPAEVFISHDGKTGYYEISEPALTEEEKRIYRDLFESFVYALEPEAVESENLAQYIEGAMWKTAEDLGLLEELRKSFAKYRYYISRDLGYGKLHIPMRDPDVAEITAVGFGRPVCVIHRKFARYGWLRTNIVFHSEEELQDYNLRLAQRFGRPLTAAVPMADIITPEGHRISLTFGDEITHPGSTLSVRKHPFEPFSLAYLVSTNTLNPAAAAYLWQVLEYRGFVQILGPVGSGKTSLLNALLATLDPNAKIITVEDVMEIRLPHENWHRFHTRPVHFAMSERFEVSLFDLLKLVMRHRPDYVVVGETRGAEMRNLTHAASLGHSCASSFHSESPEAALARMRADPINLSDDDILRVWCFATSAMVKRPGGEVVFRLNGIHEVNPTPEGKPELTEIMRYEPSSDSYSVNSTREIVKRSKRLRSAARARGMTEAELVAELEAKVKFIEDLVKRKEVDYWTYVRRVREFYATR